MNNPVLDRVPDSSESGPESMPKEALRRRRWNGNYPMSRPWTERRLRSWRIWRTASSRFPDTFWYAFLMTWAFQAYRNQASEPWIIIRAVDSSAFDVETDSETLIEQIRGQFNNVANLPGG
jgi:hypothetical protein